MTDHSGPSLALRTINPLLIHDGAIALAVGRDLLSRWRDLAALVILAIFGLAFVRNAFEGLDQPIRMAAILVISSGLAVMLDLSLRSRVRYFRTESPLAPFALEGRSGSQYRLALQAVAGIAIALPLSFPNLREAMEFIASWWFTLGLVAIAVSAGWAIGESSVARHFGWVKGVWLSRHEASNWQFAAAAGVMAIIAAGYGIGSTAASAIAATVTVLTLTWYSPVDHAVINFQRLIGHAPHTTVRNILGKPAIISLLLTAAAVIPGNVRIAGSVAATATIVLLYRYFTIMLSRIVSPRQVQFAMMILLGSTFATAMALPYATPLILIVVLFWINRQAWRRTWQTL